MGNGEPMNAQKSKHLLKQSLELSSMVAMMTSDEKYKTADIIRDCDIARLMKNSTIQHELKAVRNQHSGKIKRFLTALSRNPYAMSGVNVLFQKWSAKVEVSNMQTASR